MPRIITRIPDYIQQNYENWKSDHTYGRTNWLTRAEDSEALYYKDVEGTGTAFTRKQVKTLDETTGINVSLNFLQSAVNQKLAILSQTKPSTKTIPLDARFKTQAIVLDKMKDGLFNTTNASIEIENHIKDMLISGIGFITIGPGNFYRPGLFGLQIEHAPYDEVILDINAKKKDLDDMEGYFIEKQFTAAKIYKLYGHILKELVTEAGEEVTLDMFTSEPWIENYLTDKVKVDTHAWQENQVVTTREYFEKIFTTLYLVRNPETKVLEPYFLENLPEEAKPILANAESKIEDIYIKKRVFLGEYEIATEVIDINDYPLVATFYEWGGRPYRSYGVMHYNKDAAKASDKILSIMMLNGILSNNAGWIVPKGSITAEDKSKWEEFGNNPKVLKEYVAQEINGVLLKPEKEKVSPLSNFYPMVLELLKANIENSTGITAILQGDAKDSGVEVFSSLQQYQNAAMQRILLSTNHINQTMKNLGEVIIQYLVSRVKPDTYEFFDSNGRLNELQIALDLVNSIKKARFQVIAIPATFMPSQRLATATELMKIAQSSPDSTERSILTQKAMELSDVRGFEDIQEKIDITNRVKGQLNQLQEAYDRLMESSKQMENKVVNVSIENRILKAMGQGEVQITQQIEKAKADIEIAKEKEKVKNTNKQ